MNTMIQFPIVHLEGLQLTEVKMPVLSAPRTDVSLEEAFAVVAAYKLNAGCFDKVSLERELLMRKYDALQKDFEMSLKVEGVGCSITSFLMSYSSYYLYASISFTSRQDLLKWLAAFNLSLPTAVCKSGGVREVEGNLYPYTKLEYRMQLAFIHNDSAYKAEFSLSYERAGLPSNSCRVTTVTSHEVVCDIGQ